MRFVLETIVTEPSFPRLLRFQLTNHHLTYHHTCVTKYDKPITVSKHQSLVRTPLLKRYNVKIYVKRER